MKSIWIIGAATVCVVLACVVSVNINGLDHPYQFFGKQPATEREQLEKAANHGDAKAQFRLAYIYEMGTGIPKDEAKAVEWYQKAADQGDAGAQFCLAYRYATGAGVPKNETKSAEWYQKAADQGNASAQFQLGYTYENGIGIPKDEAKAAEWYQKAADQGDSNSQVNLGFMYNRGTGVPKDDVKAVEWYQKSASQGDVFGQVQSFGYAYDMGIGIPKDAAKAVEWYQKAAFQGNADAQYYLGVKYAKGEGVLEDDVRAYAWMNLAAANNAPIAIQGRDEMEQRLTLEKKAEAQKLSEELFEKIKKGQPKGQNQVTPVAAATAPVVNGTGQAQSGGHPGSYSIIELQNWFEDLKKRREKLDLANPGAVKAFNTEAARYKEAVSRSSTAPSN